MKRLQRRSFGRGAAATSRGLYLHLDERALFAPAVVERLEQVLRLLRRRFGHPVVLGMAGFVPVPAQVLSRWLIEGLLEQSLCVGHDDFILSDLVDAAVRSPVEAAVFADALSVLDDLQGTLRFLVETAGAEQGVQRADDGRMLQLVVRDLRRMPRRWLSGDWSQRLAALAQRCAVQAAGSATAEAEGSTVAHEAGPDTKVPAGVDALPGERGGARHLFASAAGVQRLGGLDRFGALPLLQAGLAPQDYQWWWLLDLKAEDQRPKERGGTGKQRPGWHALVQAVTCLEGPTDTLPAEGAAGGVAEGAAARLGMVFDLCPAPHSFGGGDRSAVEQTDHIGLPRQIVVGRRVAADLLDSTLSRTELAAVAQETQERVVFIASNYNKSRYLHASLYSLVMQTHPRVQVEMVDDLSSDPSFARVQDFLRLTGLREDFLQLRSNEVNRGTYWIRNDIVSRHRDDAEVLFVNDSDDCSSALRASLQLAALHVPGSAGLANFFNIVRVDSGYAPLPLNDEVERYGTASLCFRPELIRRVGYFQNLKKNADTEFIERVKRFEGAQAIPWLRYPVLFQPFDGGNLTADIYSFQNGGGGIAAGQGNRGLHTEIFRRQHDRLQRKAVAAHFGFPHSTLTRDYSRLGSDFLVEGYAGPDGCILWWPQRPRTDMADAWRRRGVVQLWYEPATASWLFSSRRHDPFSCDLGLHQAWAAYLQSQPDAVGYVVAADLAGLPAAVADLPELLSGPLSGWIHRSKVLADRWALRRDGNTLAQSKAFEQLAGQSSKIEPSSHLADEAVALLHTRGLIRPGLP